MTKTVFKKLSSDSQDEPTGPPGKTREVGKDGNVDALREQLKKHRMLFPKMTMPQPQGPRRVSVNTDGDSGGDRYNMLKSLFSSRNKDTATRQNFVRKLIEQQDRHFAYKRTVYDKMKTRLEWEKKEMELIIKIKKSEYENYFGDDFNTNEFMGKFTSRLTELEDRQEHIDVALSRLEARTDGKSREENTTQRIQAAFALIDERI